MKYWRHGITIIAIGLSVFFIAEKSTPSPSVHAQTTPDNSQPADTTAAPPASDTTPPPADITPILPPTSPLVVTVHQADAGVIVDWSDSQSGTFPLNHYLVQRSDNNIDFITLATVDNAITYTDAGGKSGEWYRIVAADNQNPANQSAPSSASQVPIPAMQNNTNVSSNNPSPDTTSPPASANPSDATPPPPPPAAPILTNSPTPPADSSAPSPTNSTSPLAQTTPASAQPNDTAASSASPTNTNAPTPTPTSPSQPSTPVPSSSTASPPQTQQSTQTTPGVTNPTTGATAPAATTSPTSVANPGQPVSSTASPDLVISSPNGTSSASSSATSATLAPLNVADVVALATSPVGHKTASVATGSGAAPADVDLPVATIAVNETNLTKTEEKKLLTSLNDTATTTVTDKASLEQQVQHDDQRNTVQPPQQRSQLLDQFSDMSVVTLNKIVLDGEPNIILPVLARYNYEKQSILELSARLDDQSKRNAKDHCQLQTGILTTTILALPAGERSMAIEAVAKCEAIEQI